jgi:hypothetical protein
MGVSTYAVAILKNKKHMQWQLFSHKYKVANDVT